MNSSLRFVVFCPFIFTSACADSDPQAPGVLSSDTAAGAGAESGGLPSSVNAAMGGGAGMSGNINGGAPPGPAGSPTINPQGGSTGGIGSTGAVAGATGGVGGTAAMGGGGNDPVMSGGAAGSPPMSGGSTMGGESPDPETGGMGETPMEEAGAPAEMGGAGGDPEPNDEVCALPRNLRWESTGPLAEPKNPNARSLKDFSVTKYNGKYLVYATTNDGEWNGFMSTFTSFDEWADAPQDYIRGLVAPTIFYFEPKDTWILAYQWGFKYATSKTPDDVNSWTPTQSLLTGDPTGGRGTGPIDQTIICDDDNCYIFFNDDAGGVYRGSMPIGNFPGAFSNVTRIMDQPTSTIFEGIQVYSIKGSDDYLMIIENNGTRAFRAWTSKDLGGEWTPLDGASTTQAPFAGENNVTWPDGKWTSDISHGDIVRENPSEKMEIDPCHLQLLYQGRDPSVQTSYEALPYRPGLLTLIRE